MMPEEWPIAAPPREAAEPAHVAGRGRLRTVRLDFFLPSEERLSEQERALMTAMLRCLVEDLASNLRASLPDGAAPANDSEAVVAERLTRAGLLDDPVLIALLLQRAEEERIGSAARARSGRREAKALHALVSHESAEVSAAAMALILARGRRRSRFGQFLLAFDDLPRPAAEHLANAVAAGLRSEHRSVAEIDGNLAAAATNAVAHHDQRRSAEALTETLVRSLAANGSLSNDLLLACAQEGEVVFIATAAALRAQLSPSVAISELLSGDPNHVARLMRVATFSRELSAGILASIGDLLGIRDPGAAIAAFDSFDEPEISSASAWLAASPGYRAAAEALGATNG